MLIDRGTKAVTGKSLSSRLGEWASGGVDRQRAELFGGVAKTRGLGPRQEGGVTHIDQRRVSVHVEANGANADEVADKVARRLEQSMRAEGQAAYARR